MDLVNVVFEPCISLFLRQIYKSGLYQKEFFENIFHLKNSSFTSGLFFLVISPEKQANYKILSQKNSFHFNEIEGYSGNSVNAFGTHFTRIRCLMLAFDELSGKHDVNS